MIRKIQFARFGSIFLINLAVKWIIDNVLNVILMVKFGYTTSLITTTIIYIMIGIISVKIYDRYEGDPFLIEDYKKNKKKEDPETGLKSVISFFKMLILGLLLSLKNTGLVVIFFRDGSYLYNGFEGKFIKLIFLIYALIINVSWNIIIYLFSPVFVLIWKMLKEIFIMIFQMHLTMF